MLFGDNETSGSKIKDHLLLPARAVATVSIFCAGFPALISTEQHLEDQKEPAVMRVTLQKRNLSSGNLHFYNGK